MEDYGDPHKAAMAYNMGVSGARNAWEAGITSTEYSTAVVEAMERWEVTVNAGMGFEPGGNAQRGGQEGKDPPLASSWPLQGGPPCPQIRGGPTRLQSGGSYERGGGVGLRLGGDPGRAGVGGAGGKGGPYAYII